MAEQTGQTEYLIVVSRILESGERVEAFNRVFLTDASTNHGQIQSAAAKATNGVSAKFAEDAVVQPEVPVAAKNFTIEVRKVLDGGEVVIASKAFTIASAITSAKVNAAGEVAVADVAAQFVEDAIMQPGGSPEAGSAKK